MVGCSLILLVIFNAWLVGWLQFDTVGDIQRLVGWLLQFDTAGDVQRRAVLQAVGDGGVNSRLVLGPY